MSIQRFYIRCMYCERPMAIEGSREHVKFILDQACPLCGEKAFRYMGEVHKTDIVRQGVKAVCDERCTNAKGPKCTCDCFQKNHGLKKLVVFNKVVGKLEVVEKDLLNGNVEYLQRIKRMAEAKNRIKQKVLSFLKFKYKEQIKIVEADHGYLQWPEYTKYSTYRKYLQQIDKIEDYTSIQKKVNTLARMLSKIGTNLEYLESQYEKEQKVTV